MERPRARRTIMWSAAVLYNARAARLLGKKNRGTHRGECPWSDKKERDAQTSVAGGRLQPAEEAMERGLTVSDGHGRFEPADEAGT